MALVPEDTFLLRKPQALAPAPEEGCHVGVHAAPPHSGSLPAEAWLALASPRPLGQHSLRTHRPSSREGPPPVAPPTQPPAPIPPPSLPGQALSRLSSGQAGDVPGVPEASVVAEGPPGPVLMARLVKGV